AIGGLVAGTYQKVTASAPGYFGSSEPGTATPGQVLFDTNFTIVHDWAALSRGAALADFNGPHFTPLRRRPSRAFDTSLTTGWGSTTGNNNGDPTNTFVDKFVVVKLPKPVDITSFQVDPSATCGDGLSASTGDVTIAVSTDGTSFTDVATASFTN